MAKVRKTFLIWAFAFFSLLRMDYDPMAALKESMAEARRSHEMRNALLSLPANASIAGDELAGTWIAGRQWITKWPDVKLLPGECPNYAVVRNSEKGTLVERGVSSLIFQCRSHPHASLLNSDLKIPTPLWRIQEWSAYRISN